MALAASGEQLSEQVVFIYFWHLVGFQAEEFNLTSDFAFSLGDPGGAEQFFIFRLRLRYSGSLIA
jgi:hypothetical protein